MTVQTETSISGPYAGSGTTGPFTVGFRFLADSHLLVVKTSSAGVDTTLALTTDYTVTGAGGSSGTVTLVTALATGESLTIARDVPFTQLADYVNNDAFPAESHEDALDLLTMQTQQLKELGDRSLSLPVTAVGVSTELPAPEASTIIGWNAAGDALDNVPLSSLATAIAATTWRTDTFNGTGAQTAFTLTDNPGNTYAVLCSVGGVVQTPGVNFTISGTTLTFLTGAPPTGTSNVVVQYGQSLPALGTVEIGNGGTGATTAEAALVALGERTGSTGSAILPAGTTAQRDVTPQAGYLRYNATLDAFEGYKTAGWGSIGGGATGSGGDQVFYENDTVVNNDHTITRNSSMVGPLEVATGKTLTIATGKRLVIL